MAPRGFVGTIEHTSLPGGQAAARVEVGRTGLRARTATGACFELPYGAMQLQPAAGMQVACVDFGRRLTIASAAPGFVRALTRAGGRHLKGTLAPWHWRPTRSTGRRGLLLALAVAAMALLAYGMPPLLRRSLQALAGSICPAPPPCSPASP